MNVLLALFLILFEAFNEGLRERGLKGIAGLIEFIYLAVITLIAFQWVRGESTFNVVKDTYTITIIGYVFFRHTFFDPVLNIITKQRLFYIGRTKWSDKTMRLFFDKTNLSPDHVLFMTRLISFCIGLTFLMGWRFGIL
jgi:hypothetical protein